jgi:uncharacterized membrane protein
MFKQKWLIGVIAFNALVIVVLTVFLFYNFSSINITKGIVLIIIAGIVMFSVVGLIIYLTRSLASKDHSNKNTPQ